MHDVCLCLKLLTESKKCREHGTLILIVCFAFREKLRERDRQTDRERERERERERGRRRGDHEINRWIDRPLKPF